MESSLFSGITSDSDENNTLDDLSENLSDASDFESFYDNDIENDYDLIGEYFFESTRLAYKADTDYKNLVQAIVVMEATREQAQKDHSKLFSHQKEAMENPNQFLEKLENQDVQIPKTLKPPCIPILNWDKYVFGNSFGKSCKMTNIDENREFHKGRKRNKENVTFNQPWTDEEQSRLEELLLMFPPEEVESNRWKKISKCLGTRTPIQVASRIQKYFARLYKAGIPIPGHIPYINKKYRKASNRQFINMLMTNNMEDDNSRSSFNSVTSSTEDNLSEEEISDMEDIGPEIKHSAEYQELLLVRKALKKKLSKG